MRLFATSFFLLFGLQIALCQLHVEQELHHYAVEDLDNYQETISVIGQNRSNSEESLGFLVNEDAELLNYQLYQRKGSKWKPSKLKREMTIETNKRYLKGEDVDRFKDLLQKYSEVRKKKWLLKI